MELSVRFTDKNARAMQKEGYVFEHHSWGNIYYPQEQIVIQEYASVNYVIHPWIQCCEVEGIEIK